MGATLNSKVRFVVMEGPPADYPAKFRAAAKQLGLDAEVESYPHVEPTRFSREKLRHIRALLKRRDPDELVFFCPGALEHYVAEADFSFHFSGYHSWWDHRSREVIPHPWTPVSPLGPRSELRWSEKPPCTIGFMGSAYSSSRIARLASNLPRTMRNWILQGRLIRNADRVAWMDEKRIPFRFLPTFARFEALNAVARSSEPDTCHVEIIDTAGFDFSTKQKQSFASHLERTTYVLCPRGCENFSFRLFEALRFGRVPVIIDTDMVPPFGVDLSKISIIVPGDEPHRIREMILEDYEGHTAESFAARQSEAFRVSDYLDSEAWMADAVGAAVEKVLNGGRAASRRQSHVG